MRFDRLLPHLAAAVSAAAAVSLLLGCAETTPAAVERPTGPAASTDADLVSFDTRQWGAAHSKRYGLTVPLPDPQRWTIDDHSQPAFVVRHAPTRTVVSIYTTTEPALVNRQRCEERARSLGFVPAGNLSTVEDEVTIAPAAYDTRLWVALRPGKSERDPIAGHLFAFGGYVRKCLFFHFQSEVPSAREESALATRLALARTRVFGALTLDDFDNPARSPGPSQRPPPSKRQAPQ